MSRLVFKAAVLLLLAAIAAIAQRPDGGPMPGDLAPDFTLNTKDGTQSITLSEQVGRPTVLIFASYT